MREQLTESDVKKIEEEIQHRKHVIRKEAIEAVKEARAQGDLSENFEYHAAKKYKNQNESRIRYLERMLKSLIRKALAEMQRQTQNRKVYRGKQSVKHLLQQGGGASTIEVSSASIRTFERVARKYGVDFAVRKDSAAEKPRYLIFFKARDADAMTAAFQEYTAKVVQREKKPSIREQLAKLRIAVLDKEAAPAKTKDKEVSL